MRSNERAQRINPEKKYIFFFKIIIHVLISFEHHFLMWYCYYCVLSCYSVATSMKFSFRISGSDVRVSSVVDANPCTAHWNGIAPSDGVQTGEENEKCEETTNGPIEGTGHTHTDTYTHTAHDMFVAGLVNVCNRVLFVCPAKMKCILWSAHTFTLARWPIRFVFVDRCCFDVAVAWPSFEVENLCRSQAATVKRNRRACSPFEFSFIFE